MAYQGPDLELTDGDVQIKSTLGARIRRDHPQRDHPRHALVSDRRRACIYGLTLGSKCALWMFAKELWPIRGGRAKMGSANVIGTG